MNKLVILAGAALVAAPAAFASPTKKVAKKAPTEVKCAVMPDHKVNIKDATAKKMFADYKGNRYFFCCAGCPGAFNKNPAKFAKADHIKIPAKKG